MPLSSNIRALFDALSFDGRPYCLNELDCDALDFADRHGLTLLLCGVGSQNHRLNACATAQHQCLADPGGTGLQPVSEFFNVLSQPAASRITSTLARNSIRVERVQAAYREIADLFEHHGIDHVVLKGFTHVPCLVPDARLRVQYDLDLYVPRAQQIAARDALRSLGYEPIEELEGLAMDHLPTMIRKTGWEWRGDYFDPEIPISVEVHFRFWDATTERLHPEGLDAFWTRRQGHRLHPVDILGYAALHLTRHLLRGNVRASHAWEIGRFLHTRHDPAFWKQWKQWHAPSLRRLEAVAFQLARWWFACDLPPEAEREVQALPESTRRWFEDYGRPPVDPPNKRELWLHMSLVELWTDRVSILRRRLLPFSLPGPVDAVHIQEKDMTLARRVKKHARYAAYTGSRAIHHGKLLAPTLREGFNWWLRSQR